MTPSTLHESQIIAFKLPTHGWWDGKWHNLYNVPFSIKLDTHKPFDQAVPFLDIYPTDILLHRQNDLLIRILVAVVFLALKE